MITQTKYLKDLLKYYQITDSLGTLRVRCKRNHRGEYGPAVAHTRHLTPEEITKLKEASQYIKIFNYPPPVEGGYGFAIIEY